MPLSSEVEYWESVAHSCVGNNELTDNVWKRPEQIKRLLKYNWLGTKILEIGMGNALIAGALKVILQGHFGYTGTELAPSFREFAKRNFRIDAVEADVLELPGEGYDRIIALDSLEHVRPEHRERGYAKIASVAKKDALLFIHLSRSTSYHDKQFDHPFGLRDLVMLEDAGFVLNNYERYECVISKSGERMDYAFVVMQK